MPAMAFSSYPHQLKFFANLAGEKQLYNVYIWYLFRLLFQTLSNLCLLFLPLNVNQIIKSKNFNLKQFLTSSKC